MQEFLVKFSRIAKPKSNANLLVSYFACYLKHEINKIIQNKITQATEKES